MAKLAKRELRFPRKDWIERRKLKGFTKSQRKHEKKAMPKREAAD